jgi:hypothetical protein
MTNPTFDYRSADAQAMPVEPVEPEAFDIERYAGAALAAEARYADFLSRPEGIAVWQRVRPGAVFRDACRDMHVSLRLQLGALKAALAYATDAPAYLEPWYGIGTTASSFGGNYEWPEGQAPVIRPMYRSLAEMPPLVPRPHDAVPILRYTLQTIEYFLEVTQGRVPLSWSDLQSPLNVATELVDTSTFFLGMVEQADRVAEMLSAIADELTRFTRHQTELIGPALARPGHGFASARTGRGIGLSADNLVMISPRLFERACVPVHQRIGEAFDGLALHSCGNWARWLPAVRKIGSLLLVDAAFSPQTDPDPNRPEAFRDALAGTGVIVQARVVGDPDQVLDVARRLWAPGMRLIVVTYVPDPAAQRRLYAALHSLCA